jgi:hypothetical protein
MKITDKNMERAINTPRILALVQEYLFQQDLTVFRRNQVNLEYAKLLRMNEVYNEETGKRIFDQADLWKASDEDFNKICRMADVVLKEKRIKSESEEWGVCPALVEENKLRIIARKIVESVMIDFDITIDMIFSKPGAYEKMLDLIIKLGKIKLHK